MLANTVYHASHFNFRAVRALHVILADICILTAMLYLRQPR